MLTAHSKNFPTLEFLFHPTNGQPYSLLRFHGATQQPVRRLARVGGGVHSQQPFAGSRTRGVAGPKQRHEALVRNSIGQRPRYLRRYASGVAFAQTLADLPRGARAQ